MLVTDNGTGLLSGLVESFCDKQGIRILRTTPYHPRTNGRCERFNGILKSLLGAYIIGSAGSTWTQYLGLAVSAYRCRPLASGYSPCFLTFGCKPLRPPRHRALRPGALLSPPTNSTRPRLFFDKRRVYQQQQYKTGNSPLNHS